MTPPLVTIAIPTYNRADQLVRALGSAVAQDYPNVEILVCDNASTDHTVAVVEAAGDPRVCLVPSEMNRGPISNFRRGLELARGEYFMWLADDDWIDPDFVSQCVACLAGDQRLVLANGGVRYVDTDGSLAHFERALQLTAQHPGPRIRKYYRQVVRNGAFYGVSRTDARLVAPLDDAMASDWLHVAAIAAQGSVASVAATVHRAADGGSASLDYSYFRTIVPMAARLGRETVRHPAFEPLGRRSRMATAGAAMILVLWRLGPLRLVNRVAGLLAEALRPRLSPAMYHRLRMTYRRASFRQVPMQRASTEHEASHG